MKASFQLVILALGLLGAREAAAQTADARPAPGSPTADNLPIY